MFTTVPRLCPAAWNRRAQRIALAVAACVTLAATPASAVSMRDLIALSQAGLSDDVLIALMEADGTVFNLDAPRILELRAQGVSERVITAMIRNGHREADPQDPALAPLPPTLDPAGEPPTLVVIGEKPAEPPVVQQTTVVVPWVVPIVAGPTVRSHPRPTIPGYRGFGRFISDGWVDGRPPSRAR